MDSAINTLVDAVRANDLNRVRNMLREGRDLAGSAISYVDERRPIHFAVMNRSPEMVRLLMRSGADARQGVYPHRDATDAWTLAKERGYEDIVAILEEEERLAGSAGEDSDEPEDEVSEDDAARKAVAAGDMEWLRARRAEGGIANDVRWDDGGLLTVAVKHNRPEMLAALLDCGLDPNERLEWKEAEWVAHSQGYPLWHCAALGRLEMAETLLKRGADPNLHVDSSGSAVYSAYSHKQWEMADLLRRNGGIVSADIAAIYRQTDLARQMLADDTRGVLPPGVVSRGKSLPEDLLRFGASGGDPEIVRMALDRVDWPRDDPRWFGALTEPLYFWHYIPWLYAGNRDLDRTTYLTCFLLILERCGPNVTGSCGRTPLHEVGAMRDHVTEQEAASFARELLAAGARTDIRDDLLQSTPLGWACRWGRVSVVSAMLEHGADPIEAGAEPWARPLQWAEKKGHHAIAAMLVR